MHAPPLSPATTGFLEPPRSLPRSSPPSFPPSRRVIWLSAVDASLGYAAGFPTIAMHAVVSDEASGKPCLYLQLDNGEEGEGFAGFGAAPAADEEAEEEGEDSSEEEGLLAELRLMPADGSQRECRHWAGAGRGWRCPSVACCSGLSCGGDAAFPRDAPALTRLSCPFPLLQSSLCSRPFARGRSATLTSLPTKVRGAGGRPAGQDRAGQGRAGQRAPLA